MPYIHCLLLLASLMPAFAMSQQVRDELDVVDGPNPTLRYGFYTLPSGQVAMGRYYFIDDGSSLRVTLVPFGKTAVELPVREFDRENGKLELGWEGKPGRTCRLDRLGNTVFLGNCIEDLKVMPIAIRIVNEYDEEWLGKNFPVSDIDLAIIEKARQILEAQEQRNLDGDRNCDDDKTANRFSVFCALYVASIEVDGVYRHRRPALQAARDSLWERYPGEYAHMLRDINNNASIPDAKLIESLDATYAALQAQMGSLWQ